MPSILHRMTAWLCLAVALLTGTLPARGFVLCIEADGCVRVELKASNASCDGCDNHEASSPRSELALTDTPDSGCPCIDVAVPGCGSQHRILPKPIALDIGPWIAPLPQPVAQAAAPVGSFMRGPPAELPRPSEALALIRSVVLLV